MKSNQRGGESKQTVLLHNQKKLDDHFGGRPDHDLSFAPLLCIVHALKSIVQDTNSDHPYKLRLHGVEGAKR